MTATTEHGTTPPAAQIGRTDTAAGSSTQAAEFRLLTEGDTVGDDVRRAALQAMFPEGPKHDVAAVKATVIELICQVSFTSFVSDRSMMTIGTSFARWCLHNTPDSTFRPDRDLNEDALADYLNFEKSGVTDQTRDTYASQLRRLARQGTPRRRGTRKAASAPYSSRSRDRMWTAACAIDDWVGAESRSLLSLTFGGGIRSDEVHAFKARQVTQVGRRVVLEVISGGMWVRHVPVYGQYGQWLLTRSRELRFDDYLFRPTFLADRADAISSLVPKMRARSTVFADFKAARARHTWLTQALVAGIPYNAVSQVAGIGKDSNLPSDLLVHMPHLSSDDTYRCFDAAYNRAQVA
ncbi:hypothetical protein [Nocardioides sp.]|uniref:hypothetical protein n=1 Tax=Nocardioides sp. TaxID=35761 RepID=UPI002726EBA5|nr:hypothetical protein [Nocardioides sp.]MDO9455214.1 hypothetical protein [Nocardioides sp.]